MKRRIARALGSTPRRESSAELAALREEVDRLRRRVADLQPAVEESRRLNERLSDVLDVVVELLVPAVDRDDERLRSALASLEHDVPE